MTQLAPLPPVAVPFPVEATYRVVPAPRPLGDAPHLLLDSAWPAALRRRVARLTAEPNAVLVRDPDRDDDGLIAALQAAWALLPVGGLTRLGLEVDVERAVARQVSSSCLQAATDAVLSRQGWELLAVAWWMACADDLVVLRRSGPGELRAELLAVAFPSGWSPRRRAGATLLELHAPVADGERLQRAAPALTEALLTKGPYLQHVWGLDGSDRLDDDPLSSYDEAPVHWHLRVERQTTLPLPHLQRALFTIRPYLVALEDLTTDQRATLRAAVQGMSDAARAYKGVTPALIAQLSEGSSG